MFNLIEGKVVEQPGMIEPERNDFYEPDYEEPGKLFFLSSEYQAALKKYNEHIKSLRSYTADLSYKWLKTEGLEIDVDFDVLYDAGSKHYSLIAIPKEGSKEDEFEDQYWSQAISIIETAKGTRGANYIQAYKELHEKLKSKFSITKK